MQFKISPSQPSPVAERPPKPRGKHTLRLAGTGPNACGGLRPPAVSAAGFQARVKLATFTSNDKTWRSEKRKEGPKRQSPAKDKPRRRGSGRRLPSWACASGQSRASGSPSRVRRLLTFPTVLLGSSRAPRNGSSRSTMASPRASKPSLPSPEPWPPENSDVGQTRRPVFLSWRSWNRAPRCEGCSHDKRVRP